MADIALPNRGAIFDETSCLRANLAGRLRLLLRPRRPLGLEQGREERLGIKGFEVLHPLAHADELDRDLMLVGPDDAQDDAALGRAVEFGEDNPAEWQGFLEELGLLNRVLAGRGVEDEQNVVVAGRPSASTSDCSSTRPSAAPWCASDQQSR